MMCCSDDAVQVSVQSRVLKRIELWFFDSGLPGMAPETLRVCSDNKRKRVNDLEYEETAVSCREKGTSYESKMASLTILPQCGFIKARDYFDAWGIFDLL